ncbi:MAG: hypothetical protein KME23_23855 [Goleter apudmare HA4340-LM2]|jgi:hypothetical protein|nr:hypothetical protein [Goleter apudmare HA4340-LM2]
MVIRLHTLITSQKRYIQIDSQPHHIIGLLNKIMHLQSMYFCEVANIYGAYYEDEQDGTITFYQAKKLENSNPGIWTYLVYTCPSGEEKVFRDSSINTDINLINNLLTGQKLAQLTFNINEYLKYKGNESKYLDIQLPDDWNSEAGRAIANILVEELQAFKSLPIFLEGAGKEYMQAVLNGFIQAAQQILKINGTVNDFEAAQYDVLQKTQIEDTANLILAYNDYRLWQSALPSKSKAVEYAFNTALSLICRMR